MFHKALVFYRTFKRHFRRSEWAVRLLRLSVSRMTATEPGLVMIQIDGLSKEQLDRALRAGRMPFLDRLIKKEHYRNHVCYSGMPASTPAVQGELFYGVKGCVPEFSFLDKETGKIVKMYEPSAALKVESRLKEQGRGLLEGGSSYANIFTGGASESHVCAANPGWDGFFHAAHPLIFPVLFLLYLDIFLRTAFLLVAEFFLAVIDCVRGTFAGKLFTQELKFIPTRVAVCVLLRELVTAGAAMDIARGLPIIHLNLLGYDEQAHRRGPASLFAHWSLRGIDGAIKRLWTAAHGATRRDYDVWIYSDHGQENVRSYSKIHGVSIEEAIASIFEKRAFSSRSSGKEFSPQSKRQDFFSKNSPNDLFVERTAQDKVKVVAMGPVGVVYLQNRLTASEREYFAQNCIRTAGVPNVLAAEGNDKAVVWTPRGKFILPEDAEKVLDPAHPFLKDVAEDLARLCHHPSAGDLVLLGWDRESPVTTSFMVENGTHAGPGIHETRPFALLPEDAPVADKSYLRPLDLREGALRFLEGTTATLSSRSRKRPPATATLRVMTYNIHSAIGMDGKISPERIARVIARHAPDVIALQELDVCLTRTGCVDQARRIAQLLEMSCHFHPSFVVEDGQYGNAVLSRFPMELVNVKGFPRNGRKEELRGALWVSLDVGRRVINFITTHLSIWPNERILQAEDLCSDWIEKHRSSAPLIVCGDFNAPPGSAVCRRMEKYLRDVQKDLGSPPRPTWFGGYPFIRIDHVYVNSFLRTAAVRVPRERLERVASDHLPLVVETELL